MSASGPLAEIPAMLGLSGSSEKRTSLPLVSRRSREPSSNAGGMAATQQGLRKFLPPCFEMMGAIG
jgi:hypothetical protein